MRPLRAKGWVRATFSGWALGFVLVLVFIAVTSGIGLGDTQFAVGLGVGAGVGWMQARLLTGLVDRRAWLAASAGGMAAPFLVTDVTRLLPMDVPYSLPVLVVLGGILTGLLQWRLLRPISPAAALWVPAACVGWSLAASTAFINDRLLPRIPGIVGALLYIGVIMVGGIVLGMVTDIALKRIFRSALGASVG